MEMLLQGMVGSARAGPEARLGEEVMVREESSKQSGSSNEPIQTQKSSICPLLRWPAYRPAGFV